MAALCASLLIPETNARVVHRKLDLHAGAGFEPDRFGGNDCKLRRMPQKILISVDPQSVEQAATRTVSGR